MMQTFALDLDGVIWSGRDPIPGSADAVRRLRDAGHPVVFVTNNSFSTIAEQESKLASFGIEAAGAVITSAQAAASLVEPGERALVVGGPGVIEALQRRGAVIVDHHGLREGQEAIGRAAIDAVVVGLDWQLDYHRLAIAVQAVLGGSRFIATNTDPTYPSERGLLPGAGAIVAAVTTGSGVRPIVAGKPEPPAADLVRSRFGSVGVMIGDRPETDGAFAVALGYDFGLVLSGVTRSSIGVTPSPDLIGDDLVSVVDGLLDS